MIPPEQSGNFVASMEKVLEVYKRPYDARFPVVCMDESPKQLIGETKTAIAAEPGKPARYDYEYKTDELQKWLTRIGNILKKTYKTYIFFNNHPQGKAVKNAQQMMEILKKQMDIISGEEKSDNAIKK